MNVSHNAGIWRVDLPASAPYNHVRLKRRHADRDDYAVVNVDLDVLLQLHDRDQLRIPNPPDWEDGKLPGMQAFLDPRDPGEAEMPVVGVWDAPLPGWIAKLRKLTHPAVSFTNGRHRARLLRHFGAKYMPVETGVHGLNRLIEVCGAPMAVTSF